MGTRNYHGDEELQGQGTTEMRNYGDEELQGRGTTGTRNYYEDKKLSQDEEIQYYEDETMKTKHYHKNSNSHHRSRSSTTEMPTRSTEYRTKYYLKALPQKHHYHEIQYSVMTKINCYMVIMTMILY
ncbi:12837_t:CDS:1 [Cetraspora pellucida]|uniref:12837_t:CDS:1 n=1 Tax=Cetraspora pellucida TaxID=1433469 RepID=A0ACA9LDT0_9GLOM|nr:12837_t:CDS:1 [Cetraspora pellucida]